MNSLSLILFSVFTVAIGFANPLISFGLIILYYLPEIIQSSSQPSMEDAEVEMKSFSEDVLEDMK